MWEKIDLTGKNFGRLTAIKTIETGNNRRTKWICKCDCGNTIVVRTDALTSGKTKSCGCYKKDKVKERFFKHGLSNTRLYNSWADMKARCNHKNCCSYKDYGGRGIKVCDEWNGKNGFAEFSKWALENGYSDNLTIDRIDVNGDYNPDNCRWIPKSEQSSNTRRTKKYEYMGETHCISEWAKIKGMSVSTLTNRLKRSGLTIEQALNEPLQRGKRKWKNG